MMNNEATDTLLNLSIVPHQHPSIVFVLKNDIFARFKKRGYVADF